MNMCTIIKKILMALNKGRSVRLSYDYYSDQLLVLTYEANIEWSYDDLIIIEEKEPLICILSDLIESIYKELVIVISCGYQHYYLKKFYVDLLKFQRKWIIERYVHRLEEEAYI